MRITDILAITENDQLPHGMRCIARALLVAMLALDRYGHTISYTADTEGESEAAHDGGWVARNALEDIRALGWPLGRQQILSRLIKQRRCTMPSRLRRLLAKRQRPVAVRPKRARR